MLLILALAWAVAHPARAEAPVRTEAEARVALSQTLDALRAKTSGTILVAAAGPDAERVALAALGEARGGGVKLARVGLIGDVAAEIDRALSENALDCAVRLGPDPAGGFALATFGACAQAAPAAEPAPATASVAPAPPPVAAPDVAVLESTYKLVALQRVPVAKEGRVAWEVRDGRGKRFGAVELARTTGDAATERRLTSEVRRSKIVSFSLGGAGAVLALTGLVILASRDAGAPEWADYEPDASLYVSNDDYAVAELKAESDYDLAQDAHEIRKEDRTWIAGFCVAAGAVSLGSTPFANQGSQARANDPSLYWTEAQADDLLLAHNNGIRKNLGLPPLLDPDAPVAAPSRAAPDDADEEGDDEGDDTLEEGDAPSGEPPADDVAPGDGPAFFVTPVLGPTYAGVTVRFR